MSKITIDRSVVEQALEALFMYKPMVTGVTFQHGQGAISALRAALEQPQVTSCVACEDHPAPGNSPCAVCGKTLEQPSAVKESLTTQPQVEQKPVAWAEEIIEYLHAYYDTDMIKELDSGDALIRLDDAIAAVEEVAQRHTHPQPPRQPLTDEEIDDLLENVIGSLPVARKLIHAIERAHGITGEQA